MGLISVEPQVLHTYLIYKVWVGYVLTSAGYFSPAFIALGAKRLPATFILFWLSKDTFSVFTKSLFLKVIRICLCKTLIRVYCHKCSYC